MYHFVPIVTTPVVLISQVIVTFVHKVIEVSLSEPTLMWKAVWWSMHEES